MFPLGSVLFPHMVLPLHIFEPALPRPHVRLHPAGGCRARVRCRADRAGPRGGRGRRPVRDRDAGPHRRGGRAARRPWVLNAVGTRRVVVGEWLPDDPYPLAMVAEVEEATWSPADDGPRDDAERLVRRALALAAELGLPAVPATVQLADDPAVAAWQLAAIAPLGLLDRQRLLETPDHRSRLRTLSALTEEEITVLAYRLERG